MTDIAHCPNDGRAPDETRRVHDGEDIVNFVCGACGKASNPSKTLAGAQKYWNRAVLSDLAAQERELWMRRGYEQLSSARADTECRYVWLGQNPLSLPT